MKPIRSITLALLVTLGAAAGASAASAQVYVDTTVEVSN